MTDRTVVSVSFSADELAIIDAEHKRIAQTLIGLSITRTEVFKHMLFRTDRHLARLWDVPADVIVTDLAEALRALEVDGDEISQIAMRVFEAHAKSRELHSPPLPVSDV